MTAVKTATMDAAILDAATGLNAATILDAATVLDAATINAAFAAFFRTCVRTSHATASQTFFATEIAINVAALNFTAFTTIDAATVYAALEAAIMT